MFRLSKQVKALVRLEAGIFNAATSGTMLCHVIFPVVNKQADDTMSVTWTITLTAS